MTFRITVYGADAVGMNVDDMEVLAVLVYTVLQEEFDLSPSGVDIEGNLEAER